MSAVPALGIGDFAAFFHAVHGYEPFPWQERLARQVEQAGWPSALALPTGTGKTAVLDVAVFALALDGGKALRSAPRRIIYVVDRRTIVDQAYERANKIRSALIDPSHDVVRRVRDRLAAYAQGTSPLRTALLRGGIARDDMWARAPDQPLIAVSTVDQVGSRLLFRGYGVTDSMKPVHAGLLGNDVLYLLDEVHLSQPFSETLAAIRDRYRTWAERALPAAFVVVEMSATLGRATPSAFRLEDADRQHQILSARLQAPKPVSLVTTNPRAFPKEIEKQVHSLLGRPGATIAVVVNRVKSARDLHERLCKAVAGGSTAVHLLTGRMRPFDRDALEKGILERIRAGRGRSEGDRPVVVIATQTIEAGADFDFDGLVTECASLDALRQRFGRLDRLGVLAGAARGVIVARTDSLKDDPVYGDAIGKTWNWLQGQAGEQRVVDFGIDALVVPDNADERGLLTPKAHAPVLLPSHLDAWVQTAPIPDPDPDIALWLHGPQRGVADVQVVWRADLSHDLLNLTTAADKDVSRSATEVAISIVEALPPVSAEAMSVPFLAAKRWLEGRSEPESFDVEGAATVDNDVVDATPERPPRVAVLWQGDQSAVVGANELRPGQTIVLPSSYGGVDHANWAPASRAPVMDVAELAALRHGRRPTLRLHAAVLRALLNTEIVVPQPGNLDSETVNDREAVVSWLESQHRTAGSAFGNLLDALWRDLKSLRVERVRLGPGEDAGEYLLAVGKHPRHTVYEESVADDQATTDGSRSSFTGVSVSLADHLAGVAEVASGFATSMGLATELEADLRLAGEWHDAGKADARFQRWLHGGSEFKALAQPEPLAKAAARVSSRLLVHRARERAGFPPGGRHELMSLALVQSPSGSMLGGAYDRTLVQHLVASHHGHCRPLAPYVPDPNPVDVTFSRDGVTCHGSSAHGLARLDSGVAESFWRMVRRYGWWGLAWLEALFRLADHRQSEREQTRGSEA